MKLIHLLVTGVLSCTIFSCNSSKKLVTANQLPVERPSTQKSSASAAKTITPNNSKTDAFLENLLKGYPQYFDSILRYRDTLRVQVIYTQINRDANNKPEFTNYYFNVNPQQYFYPASTVKMPTALLALQRLHELNIPGLDKNSPMVTESAYSGQTPVYNDPSSPDGVASIAQYVRKIFLVSDNDAFNRLYEFIGQQYLNEQLRKMGYQDVEIIHRLNIFLSPDENKHTNPVMFLQNGKPIYQQPMQVSTLAPFDRNDQVGKGFMRGDSIINLPFNFSRKNRISLEDLHNILQSILFPNSVPANQRFNIAPEDYRFVWQYMSQFPPETNYPPYPLPDYWDAYCKLLYWGNEKASLPKTFRIFNKEGDAYGFLTDIAYVVDFDKNIEFMLAATIHCDNDGIVNDDKYDYATLGLPFMKHLGQVIYEFESKRPRKYKPDLSAFKLKYDK